MKKILISTLIALVSLTLAAQVTREEAAADPTLTAGLLRPYPGPLQTKFTKAPRGYKPFYISHIARHGSRWYTNGVVYDRPVKIITRAVEDGAATPLAAELLPLLVELQENATGHVGDLSPLGFEQHRGVADRMFRNYRRVFRGKGRKVLAESTASTRVMLSMYSFCQRLREGNPDLDIYMDASYRIRKHVSGTSRITKKYSKGMARNAEFKAFSDSLSRPGRLMATLFTDPEYVSKAGIDARELMQDLYSLRCIAYDMPTEIRLDYLFTPDELYDLWQVTSASYYIHNGPDPAGGDSLLCKAVPILCDMIGKADEAIAGNGTAANLRFSHDAYLAPLTTTLQLEGFRGQAQTVDQMASVWANSKASPMCVNIQMVFFRNRKGDVLVKFLHNEKECGIPIEPVKYPYYRWEDAKAFYTAAYGLDDPEKLRQHGVE